MKNKLVPAQKSQLSQEVLQKSRELAKILDSSKQYAPIRLVDGQAILVPINQSKQSEKITQISRMFNDNQISVGNFRSESMRSPVHVLSTAVINAKSVAKEPNVVKPKLTIQTPSAINSKNGFLTKQQKGQVGYSKNLIREYSQNNNSNNNESIISEIIELD